MSKVHVTPTGLKFMMEEIGVPVGGVKILSHYETGPYDQQAMKYIEEGKPDLACLHLVFIK